MKPQRKTTKKKFITTARINSLMIVALVFCGLYYLVNMNGFLADSFALEAKTQALVDLQAENQRLELQKIALETYQNLDKESADLKMVSLGQTDYLDISIAALAKN